MSSNGSRDVSGLSTEELRAAVRAVLREVLPDGLAVAPTAGAVVSMSSDAELDALVRQVASLCEDPDRRAAIQDGRHSFRLQAPAGDVHGARQARPPGGAESGEVRAERGAVTERMVVRASKAGARLVLGPRAVLTPLARDRARVLGVEIEKEH